MNVGGRQRIDQSIHVNRELFYYFSQFTCCITNLFKSQMQVMVCINSCLYTNNQWMLSFKKCPNLWPSTYSRFPLLGQFAFVQKCPVLNIHCLALPPPKCPVDIKRGKSEYVDSP